MLIRPAVFLDFLAMADSSAVVQKKSAEKQMGEWLKLSGHPCSWGVDYADHPSNPPWEKVIRRVTELRDSRGEYEVIEDIEVQGVSDSHLHRALPRRGATRTTL